VTCRKDPHTYGVGLRPAICVPLSEKCNEENEIKLVSWPPDGSCACYADAGVGAGNQPKGVSLGPTPRASTVSLVTLIPVLTG